MNGNLRWLARRLARVLLSALAFLYLLIDLLVLSLLRPFRRWLRSIPLTQRLQVWVDGLNRYVALLLLLIPWAILEPVKPLSVLLYVHHHRWLATWLIVGSEVIKLTLFEQVFTMAKPKLLSFGWFAWGYRLVTGWLDRIRALPAWQAVVRAVNRIKAKAREAIRWIRSAA